MSLLMDLKRTQYSGCAIPFTIKRKFFTERKGAPELNHLESD